MGGGAFGFGLAQRRQRGRGIALRGRGPCRDIGGVGDHGCGRAASSSGRAAARASACGPAQIMRQRFGLADMAGEIAVARRLARLALQAGKLAFDFADHVFQARQIGFGGAQAQFGLMAALVQAADAGGFFQDGAARQRLLADQKADLALAHKGGRARARRGVGEEYLHVALAHVAAIDAIDGARLALDAAGNFDGVELVVRRRRPCGRYCR